MTLNLNIEAAVSVECVNLNVSVQAIIYPMVEQRKELCAGCHLWKVSQIFSSKQNDDISNQLDDILC